jgi:hypothetical protein
MPELFIVTRQYIIMAEDEEDPEKIVDLIHEYGSDCSLSNKLLTIATYHEQLTKKHHSIDWMKLQEYFGTEVVKLALENT